MSEDEANGRGVGGVLRRTERYLSFDLRCTHIWANLPSSPLPELPSDEKPNSKIIITPLFALTSSGLIENRRIGESSAWAREPQSNVATRTSPTTAGWRPKFVFYDLMRMNPSVLNSGDGCKPEITIIPV